jgi:tetratricopeptide (TPR) repeat protein
MQARRLSGMFLADRVGDMRYILVLMVLFWSGAAIADDVDDIVQAGREALARMDVPMAMTHFDNALKTEPTHPEAAYERGRILLKMGDAKNAVADFTTAALADPTFGLALTRRGEAQMLLKNPDAAFKDFEAAIQASPKLAEVFVVRATYRLQIGNLLGAREDMEAAVLFADAQQKPVLEKMLARMK